MSIPIAIINKDKLSSSNLEIFTNVIFNNFSEISNVPELNHTKQSIYETLKCSTAQVYLILVNKKIASYIVGKIMILNDGRRVVYITYLYTAKQFRGKGFASVLLSIAEKINTINMLDGVMLTYDSENIPLHNFYLKKGFMPDLLLRTYKRHEVLYRG